MPRDHIREFYEAGGYIKPSKKNRTQAALKRVRFDAGGPMPAVVNPSKVVAPLMRWTEGMWNKLPELQRKAAQKVGLHAMKEGKEGFIYGRSPADYTDPGFASQMTKGDEGSVRLPAGYMKFVKNPDSKPGTGQAWNVHSHPGKDATAFPSSVPGDMAMWLMPHANRFRSYPEGTAKPWQEMMIIAPHHDQLLKVDPVNQLWEGMNPSLASRHERLRQPFFENILPNRYLANRDFLSGGPDSQIRAMQEWAKAHGVELPRAEPIRDIDPKTGKRLEENMGQQFWPVYQSLAGGRWMDELNKRGVGAEMDAATKLPYTDVDLRDAWDSYVPFAKQRFFAEGGPVGFAGGGPMLAAPVKLGNRLPSVIRNWVDPAANLIDEWAWKPLKETVKAFPKGLPREVPDHVLEYGDFMRRQARNAELHGVSPRDLLKAYTGTLSSIQRQAINRDKLTDITLSSPDQLIRPEGAFADWLGGKQGQKYLDYGSQGEAHPDAVAAAVKAMQPFGLHNKLGEDLTAAPGRIQGIDARISEIIARAAKGQSTPEEWAEATEALKGIDAAKKGFVGAFLGYGDRPTLDARQLQIHTDEPELLSKFGRRQHGQGGEQAVARLANRQNAYGTFLPPDYRPFGQHLLHHTYWDAANDTKTTHRDLMDMMENRAEGGRVGYAWRGLVKAGEGAEKLGRSGAKYFKDLAYELMPERRLIEQIADQTGHSVDKIVDLVRSKQKGTRGDPETVSGWSSRKGSPELYTTASGLVLPDNFARRRLSPEDIYGKDNYLVTGMSDRTGTGRILGLNETPFERMLRMRGGSDYPYTQEGDIWASDQGPLTSMVNAAKKAGATDDSNVFYANKLMGAQAGDQSYQSMQPLTQMLENAPMSKAQREEFDRLARDYKISMGTNYAKPFPDWRAGEEEGSAYSADKILAYLNKKPMSARSPLMKFLDQKQVQDLGAPDPTAIRMAITDPALFGVPDLTVGRTVGKIDMRNPFNTAPTNPHPDYPTGFRGTQMGTMDRPLPPWIAQPDYFADRKLDPNNLTPLDRSTYRITPAVQKLDDKWLDQAMKWWEANPQGWTPSGLKRGGRVGYAVGGPVEMPPVGAGGGPWEEEAKLKRLQVAAGIKPTPYARGGQTAFGGARA